MLTTRDFTQLAGSLYTVVESPSCWVDTDTTRTSVYFRTDTDIQEQFTEKKTCCFCSAEFKNNMSTLWEDLRIFPLPLLNMLDHVSDISMTVHFLSDANTRNLGYISLLILILQRISSAAILGHHYGWVTGVRQFFDIEVFFAMYQSIRRHRTVLTIIQLKILEGFYESFPELCIQTYYLVKPSHDNKGGFIIYASITLSMLSLSKCWLFSDEVAIPWRGLSYRFSKTKAENYEEQKLGICDSFSTTLCMLILWAWRFGEISITLCILVAFANVISARGSFILIGLLLFSTYVIQKIWPQSREASWFYQVSKHSRSEEYLSISEFGSGDIIGDISMKNSYWQNCKDEILFYCNSMYRLFILFVLWVAELNYSFWALPTFYPRTFVMVYYVLKVLLQVALLTACIAYKVNEGYRGIRMLWSEIFNELWWYYVIGLFLSIFGGIATWLFVIDTEQYKRALGADADFLLKMVDSKQWILIERLVRNGVCSVFHIIEDANEWMIENNVVPTDEKAMEDFATQQVYCKLLYYLIKQKIFRIGPRETIIPPAQISQSKYYRHWAIPALLYRCNDSREITTRSYLATTVLSKLVEKRKFNGVGSRRLVHWTAIRNAGASLKFLRYHLKAPEYLFRKSGTFECTARQLYKNGFDILFCLRADFSREELVLAGFDKKALSNNCVTGKDVNGNWPSAVELLERLKQSGFTQFHRLNFTFEELRASNVFTTNELLRYKQGFMFVHWTELSDSELSKITGSIEIFRANSVDFTSSRSSDILKTITG